MRSSTTGVCKCGEGRPQVAVATWPADYHDATGELLPGGHFVEQECTLGYLRVLREGVAQKGVPLSAYMDRQAVP
jgi:hypothetical protein